MTPVSLERGKGGEVARMFHKHLDAIGAIKTGRGLQPGRPEDASAQLAQIEVHL